MKSPRLWAGGLTSVTTQGILPREGMSWSCLYDLNYWRGCQPGVM